MCKVTGSDASMTYGGGFPHNQPPLRSMFERHTQRIYPLLSTRYPPASHATPVALTPTLNTSFTVPNCGCHFPAEYHHSKLIRWPYSRQWKWEGTTFWSFRWHWCLPRLKALWYMWRHHRNGSINVGNVELNITECQPKWDSITPWASYQIRKIVDCSAMGQTVTCLASNQCSQYIHICL